MRTTKILRIFKVGQGRHWMCFYEELRYFGPDQKNTPCGVLEFCLIVELRGLRSLAPFWITIQHLDHSVEITGLRFFELILFSLERTLYLSKGTICLSPSPINGHGFDSHIRTDNLSYFY